MELVDLQRASTMVSPGSGFCSRHSVNQKNRIIKRYRQLQNRSGSICDERYLSKNQVGASVDGNSRSQPYQNDQWFQPGIRRENQDQQHKRNRDHRDPADLTDSGDRRRNSSAAHPVLLANDLPDRIHCLQQFLCSLLQIADAVLKLPDAVIQLFRCIFGLTRLLIQFTLVYHITVRELTDYVNLNRGTFYLHYKDIFDLLEQIENEMLEHFSEILVSRKACDMKGRPFPLLKDIFLLLGENADFCRCLLGDNSDQKFIRKLMSVLREKCFCDWDYLFEHKNEEIFELFYSYMLSGCVGVIEKWLFDGMRQTPEQMALILEKMMLRGISVLQED